MKHAVEVWGGDLPFSSAPRLLAAELSSKQEGLHIVQVDYFQSLDQEPGRRLPLFSEYPRRGVLGNFRLQD